MTLRGSRTSCLTALQAIYPDWPLYQGYTRPYWNIRGLNVNPSDPRGRCVIYRRYLYLAVFDIETTINLQISKFNSSFYCKTSRSLLITGTGTMCFQIVERYSVCRCLYHKHSVDPCQRYGQRGHSTTEKTVLVGFACPDHAARRKPEYKPSSDQKPTGSRHWHDSGYSSGGYGSNSGRR